MADKLGVLKRVDPRTHWSSEPGNFTPWLAKNLQLLAKDLRLDDLELESTEKSVGSFQADIVCKEAGREVVLIENQLEQTNHDHLGKLLTYASGLEAVTVIWIAKKFRDEHRAALDWLNKLTDESVRFFGLEIELWCIGDSLPAPKFNIVSKPNTWSREASQFRKETEVPERRVRHLAYWGDFIHELNSLGAPISAVGREPSRHNSMWFGVGRRGISLEGVTNTFEGWIRVQLTYSRGMASQFNLLKDRGKSFMEESLSKKRFGQLQWEARKVYCSKDADPTDTADWPDQHQWIASCLVEMHQVVTFVLEKLDEEAEKERTEEVKEQT